MSVTGTWPSIALDLTGVAGDHAERNAVVGLAAGQRRAFGSLRSHAEALLFEDLDTGGAAAAAGIPEHVLRRAGGMAPEWQ